MSSTFKQRHQNSTISKSKS